MKRPDDLTPSVIAGLVILAVLLGSCWLALAGWLLYLVWGLVAVGAFGAPALGYWPCVGIVLLLNILISPAAAKK